MPEAWLFFAGLMVFAVFLAGLYLTGSVEEKREPGERLGVGRERAQERAREGALP